MLIAFGQCFPRYRYREPEGAQGDLPGVAPALERIDNIPEAALRAFRARYADPAITRDDIFDYVYAVLLAPAYGERFADDLARELPRVPLAPDFRAFARAGRELGALHLGYETCEEYPLELVFDGEGAPGPEHYWIGARRMRLSEDRTALRVNDRLTLRGIPPEAFEWRVNGRTPLEWLIDRYRVARDKESGIVNDPNAWFADPQDLVAAIRRIVHLTAIETARTLHELPDPFGEEGDSARN